MAILINDTTPRSQYTATASQTVFSVPFEFFSNADLLVYQNSTLKTLTTHYTVTGAGLTGGGSITLVTGAAASDIITIVRDIPVARVTDFPTSGPFNVDALNLDLDRLTAMTQQQETTISRSLRLDQMDTPNSFNTLPVVSSRATKVLAFDANGQPISSNLTLTVLEGQATASAASATASAASATAAASSASASSTSATNSSNSATSSASSAASSASSAASAAATLASGLYSAVQDKSANYTVVLADAGDLLRVTTTAGAVTITLPEISTVVDGFKVAIVKWSSDTNAVTIARSGSDTINGAISASIGLQYTQTTFIADFETNQWFASTSGLGATNVVVDAFNGTGSQTAFTLSGDPSVENNTYVYVSGVYQSKATYSLSGTTLTFSTAPPSGTANIEVVWTQPLSVGTPSDGTVTPAKLSTGGPSWTSSGNLTTAGTVAMGSSFLRNRLINGNMYVAQRSIVPTTVTAGTAVPTAVTGYPCVDRWFVYSTGANVTAAQVAGATNNKSLLQVTGAASVTAVGIGQRIEQLNSYDLAGQTCTLSVNIANSLLTTVTWTASYATTTADTFGTIGTPTKTQIATGTFTVTSTLTQYTTNIAVPAAATTGIEILFTVGAQTSGTWQIGNAQLEVGSVATPFERQIYSNQLAQCQRYYSASFAAIGTMYNGNGAAVGYTTYISTKVSMRIAPTIVLTSAATSNVTSSTTTNVTVDGYCYQVTVTATGNFSRTETTTLSAEIA